jgi:hypothetical protein
MEYRFEKHYTREEAQALLPKVRQWLDHLKQLRDDLDKYDKRLTSLMAPGHDVGGDMVNKWIRTLSDMQAVLLEF